MSGRERLQLFGDEPESTSPGIEQKFKEAFGYNMPMDTSHVEDRNTSSEGRGMKEFENSIAESKTVPKKVANLLSAIADLLN